MAIVQNPQNYDSKLPTNIRIVGLLKDLALQEAKERGVPLALIVNESLAERYKVAYVVESPCKEEQPDERVDTESSMG